ncbi:MAG: hypothetical protein R3C19_06330 [Planctomycetaceae bacterium]
MLKFVKTWLLTVCFAGLAAELHAGCAEYIVLNDQANQAVLEDDGDPFNNIIQIRSTNGTFDTIQFEQPTDILFIAFGGGDDELTVDGESLPGFTADLLLYGEQGNDRTRINHLDTQGGVYSEDPHGDNRLQLFACSVVGDVSAVDGPGFQTFIMSGNYGGNVFVQSPDGGSTIWIGTSLGIGYYAFVDGAVLVDNHGYGPDTVQVSGSLRQDLWLNLGHGDASLRSIFSGVSGDLSFLVESGMSEVFLGDFSVLRTTRFKNIQGSTDVYLVHSGFAQGLEVRNGLGYDTYEFRSVWTPELKIENGDGGSFTKLVEQGGPFGLEIGRLSIMNGDGSDEIVVENGHGDLPDIGSLKIDNGNGNSRTSIGFYAEVGEVEISNGNGFDDLLVEGTVNGRLVSLNGNGGSGTYFDGAFIGGDTEIHSNAGMDYFEFHDTTIAGNTDLQTGDDNDLLLLSNSEFLGDFVAAGGSGFDIFATSLDNIFGGLYYVTGFDWTWEL